MNQTLFRKLTALLLSLSLCAGVLPLALAEESGGETQESSEETQSYSEETVPSTEAAAIGLSDADKQAILNRNLTGLVFPLESAYYSAIYDFAGCQGAWEGDELTGYTNTSCRLNHSSSNPNDGLDIAVPYGTAVYAPSDGIVYSAGTRVVVQRDAGNGYAYYFILENVAASVSDDTSVTAGTQIGTACGDVHYLAVMYWIGYASRIAWDDSSLLTQLRGGWLTDSVGTGLVCVNPSPSYSAQGNSITSMLVGPSYTFPTAAQPVVTEPAATDPVVTEPVVTQPVVTDPVVTEPVVTVPPVTEHVHSWDSGTVVLEPTNTSDGIRRYTCLTCGATYDETISATHTEHVWDAGTVIQEATATTDGILRHTCMYCNAFYDETIPATHTEHTWDAGTYVVQPTHLSSGLIEYTCTVCGEKRQETVEPIADHTYDQQVVSPEYLAMEATCSGPAVYYYSCVCGAKGTDTFTWGSALAHTFSTEWSSNDIYHWHAATCGHTQEISDQAAHVWDEGVITKEAGHLVDGEILYTCTVCGLTRTEKLSGETHAFNQEVIADKYLASAATCTEPAVYYYSCVCGEKGTETFTYGEALGHTFAEAWSYDENQHWKAATCGHDVRNQVAVHGWNAGEVTTPATSTTPGVRTYTCYECGMTRTETIEPTTHVHTFSTAWTYNEYAHWHVATCRDTTECSMVIDSYSAHVWGTGTYSTDSTGHTVLTKTCLTCGMVTSEKVHSYNQQVISQTYLKSAATCTTPATYYYSCSCGEKGTETFTYGSAYGHTYATTWSSDASYHWHVCTVCGTRGDIAAHSYNPAGETCTICGYSSTASHVHTSHLTRVIKKEATCTTDGNIAYWTCSCGKWFSDSLATEEITDHTSVIIPATGHVDANNDGRCDVCKERMSTETVEYQMTEGGGSTWLTNASSGLVFRSNAEYSKFDHVEVDGSTVSGFNYTVSAGSTIVELNVNYLQHLSAGSHTIAVVSSDGRAETTFTVKQAASESSGSGIWIVVAVVAVIAILAAIGLALYLYFTGRGDGDGGLFDGLNLSFGGGSGSKKKRRKGGKFAR